MFSYFKDLLQTLKDINHKLTKIEENTKKVSDCVNNNSRSYGDDVSISTKNWNA